MKRVSVADLHKGDVVISPEDGKVWYIVLHRRRTPGRVRLRVRFTHAGEHRLDYLQEPYPLVLVDPNRHPETMETLER